MLCLDTVANLKVPASEVAMAQRGVWGGVYSVKEMKSDSMTKSPQVPILW